jgi:mannose-1-phosphate guanylyltransferase
MKVLILAGGRGTRLWPLSRKQKPKQFQKLISKKTMLQETIERLPALFKFEDIFISTFKEYFKEVQKEIPEIPKENIVVEPVTRERVAAILLFLTKIRKEEFKDPILILPSDHLIRRKEEFLKSILVGEEFIKKNPEFLLLLGEKPALPDTGLGYIKKGKFLKDVKGVKIYQVDFFKEKPNLKRARDYLKSGDYFWNTAIYIFTPFLIEKLTKQFVPDNFERYQRIKKAKNLPNFNEILEKEHAAMDSASLEYSIIENYQNRAFIPLDMGWSDIGSWTVLKNCLSAPDKSYVKGDYIGIDSKNIMVYGASKQLVAGVGIKDLIAVITDDIILLCHKDKSQKVKEIIKKLEKQNKIDHL